MARVKGAVMTRKRRNKVLKLAKGYWGAKSKHFKMAKQAVMKSGNYAFAGRKMKKRDFRSLWITRISAQAKVNGINYSQLMHGLKLMRTNSASSSASRRTKRISRASASNRGIIASLAEKPQLIYMNTVFALKNTTIL